MTLIAVTAPIAALGLWLFGRADTPVLAFAAAALLAVGTAFWWPTMLGLTSERFPRGGALALAMVGAAGAFSTAVAGPVMGWINNTYGAAQRVAGVGGAAGRDRTDLRHRPLGRPRPRRLSHRTRRCMNMLVHE